MGEGKNKKVDCNLKLINLINSEKLSFSSQLEHKTNEGWEDRDYFIFWTNGFNKKSMMNYGNIFLAPNDRILKSFKAAMEIKYRISIPDHYDTFLALKLNRELREEYRKYYKL